MSILGTFIPLLCRTWLAFCALVIGHLSTGNNDGNCDGYDGNDTGYSDDVIEVVIIVAVIVVISINFALFLANGCRSNRNNSWDRAVSSIVLAFLDDDDGDDDDNDDEPCVAHACSQHEGSMAVSFDVLAQQCSVRRVLKLVACLVIPPTWAVGTRVGASALCGRHLKQAARVI